MTHMTVVENWTPFDGEYLPIELSWFIVVSPQTDGDEEGYRYTGDLDKRLLMGYADYASDGYYYIDGAAHYVDLKDNEMITHWMRVKVPDMPKE
jgi:hypothetical protein